MLHLDLRDVFATGRLGPIGPSANRRTIYEALGEPDEHIGPTPWHPESLLWRFGDIEAHFYGNDVYSLAMLWCDDIPLPGRLSTGLDLDPWALGGDSPIVAKEFEGALWEAGIPYRPTPRPRYCERELWLESGWRIGIGHPDVPEIHEQVAYIKLSSE